MADQSPLDGVLTYIGCCLVTGPSVLLVSSFVLPSIPSTPLLPFVVLLVAVPVAWLYRRAGKSLGDLGTFIFVTAALFMIVGFSLIIAVRTFDAVLSTEMFSRPVPTFVVLAIAYAGGYYLVYRGGYARLKSTVAESV